MHSQNNILYLRLSKVRSAVLCGSFAAMICVGAFIKIPVPFVPFTLQFLFTTLAGILLGSRLGAMSVLVYICLGLIGLPVFAMGGGPAYILQPTFGYILGFCIGTLITGIIAEKKASPSIIRLVVANFVGLAVVYACGIAYFYFIVNFYTNSPMGIGVLFIYGFVLAVPGDLILCILGAFIGKKLLPIVRVKIS